MRNRADHCGHQAAPFWCEFPLFLPCCDRVPPPVLCSQSFCSAATKTAFLCGHVPKKQNLIDTEQKHSNGKKTPPAPEIRKRFNVPIVLSIITFSLPPLLCNPQQGAVCRGKRSSENSPYPLHLSLDFTSERGETLHGRKSSSNQIQQLEIFCMLHFFSLLICICDTILT